MIMASWLLIGFKDFSVWMRMPVWKITAELLAERAWTSSQYSSPTNLVTGCAVILSVLVVFCNREYQVNQTSRWPAAHVPNFFSVSAPAGFTGRSQEPGDWARPMIAVFLHDTCLMPSISSYGLTAVFSASCLKQASFAVIPCFFWQMSLILFRPELIRLVGDSTNVACYGRCSIFFSIF